MADRRRFRLRLSRSHPFAPKAPASSDQLLRTAKMGGISEHIGMHQETGCPEHDVVGQCPSEVLAPADGLPEIRQGDVVPLGIQGEVVSHDTDDSASGACYCRSTPGNVARMLGGDNSIYSRLSPQRDAHWSLPKRSLYSVADDASYCLTQREVCLRRPPGAGEVGTASAG